MAKKTADVDEGAETPNAEGEAQAATGKKGIGRILGALKSKKALMIGAPVLVLLLAGGGAGGYFLMKKPAHENEKLAKAEEAPLVPPKVAFSDVPEILVNIQGNDGTPAYLKLSISLELDDETQQAGATALMPRLVDQFQSYLRELRLEDLKGSDGVLRLKEELLRRVNAAGAPYKVRDVLLKQMIVQ